MKKVEFYYDLVSPFSYLAQTQIDRVRDETGAEISWRPMLLGAVHKLSGNSAPITVPAKGRYSFKDIHRWAAHYGASLQFPEAFPFKTITTMRAAVFCEERGKLEEFTREAFKMYWEDGNSPDGLEADESGHVSEVARRIGMEPEEVLEGASEQRVKDKLKNETERAVERGVFGAPAFFVGDEMFWGNDRLHFVEGALAGKA
ncbi:MAG: 2-hydroxychromene-2-carboxylate isomerase [Actinomycetota bacterium]|jgi:2-hydroxychromene-2-carboxylate isomerase|nr:2-hydroxychromene-2-carboxylate isomerase [Rubrobacter sp.]MDQ3509217.1 2-hydroxychromene-2-carboxylate isomerase [Actinomycetota bacterium]